ncbi:hypothetical protein NL676_017105 [Syzygium grande]|nr:hypothetical protein NL676_017105 [Syzygium grande]
MTNARQKRGRQVDEMSAYKVNHRRGGAANAIEDIWALHGRSQGHRETVELVGMVRDTIRAAGTAVKANRLGKGALGRRDSLAADGTPGNLQGKHREGWKLE